MTDSRTDFVARFGGIYEHSPWVAEACFDECRDASLEIIAERFRQCVDAASDEQKMALIRAHPDLAGKAAMRGDLTAESTSEQASAGIDQCSPQEFADFVELNAAYKAKFGFPFIMAVRNSNRFAILHAFRNRLDNDYDTEFATALAEIHKIAALRLEAL